VKITNLFFKDVCNSGYFDELYLSPVSDGLEDGKVQSFGCVVEN